MLTPALQFVFLFSSTHHRTCSRISFARSSDSNTFMFYVRGFFLNLPDFLNPKFKKMFLYLNEPDSKPCTERFKRVQHDSTSWRTIIEMFYGHSTNAIDGNRTLFNNIQHRSTRVVKNSKVPKDDERNVVSARQRALFICLAWSYRWG